VVADSVRSVVPCNAVKNAWSYYTSGKLKLYEELRNSGTLSFTSMIVISTKVIPVSTPSLATT
jgi:hypothetical protein